MKKFIIILGFFFMISGLWAQEQDSLSRPKIGLVLSGGGAKGMAHIGVLKVLEKYHIKPDYIGGTSMGALVGSLYASGYSAQQIDSLFHTMNFDDILYNRYDRKYQNYFKKEYGNKYILGFPFSFSKMSAQLPRGLSDSQKMFNTLAESMLHVSNVDDFSHLKIPFICPATDIATGEQVLFTKGYLPLAATSSALLPSAYAPLEVKGRLLLDGGIVNNYPVQEVKDLGADFIIGSDVQGKILNKDEITDIPAIMDQIVSFGMYKEMPLKKTMTDIYIHPNIKGIGLTDFDNLDTIIKRGEIAAEKMLKKNPDLKKLQDKNWKIKKLKIKKPDSIVFDQIVLYGQKNFKREYILGKIDIKPHKKVSYKDFLEGINNIIGTDNFEKIHYRIKNEKSKNILYLNIKERRHKAYMNIGFHYNDLYKINVIGNFENKRVFTKNDWMSLDIIGGNNFRYSFDYIIDNGFKLSWGFHSSLHKFNHQVSADDLFADEHFTINMLDYNYLQFSNKIYFQGNLNHFVYLRIGAQHQFKKLYTYVFSSDENEAFYFGKNHYFGNFISINFDNRDDFDFPTKGLYFKTKWNYIWASSDYYDNFNHFSLYTLNFNLTQNILNNWYYLQPDIKAGLHYGKTHQYENIFYLGGINQYMNYDNIYSFKPMGVLSVKATKFVSLSLNNMWKIYKNHFINLEGNILIYDQSDDFFPEGGKNIYGYSIGYGFKSFLGPLKLIFGRALNINKNQMSFSFGYSF